MDEAGAKASGGTADPVVLRRTVRFAVNEPLDARTGPQAGRPRQGEGDPGRVRNGFAGFPALRALGRHYELVVACRGPVDPRTGYFLNIKRIDEACRERAIPLIQRACEEGADDAARVLAEAAGAVNEALGGVVRSVRWMLTPYHSIEMAPTTDPDTTPTVLMRQIFEFAAAHRLSVPELTGEENRRLFGKCTNPRGHGHNYKVEPCVAVPLTASPSNAEVSKGSTEVAGKGTGRRAAPVFTLADLERLTDETIIERFDHKHLNEDTPEFGHGGLNPSVENIAKVCFDLLAAAIEREGSGARLACVTVWETDKTSCTYPG